MSSLMVGSSLINSTSSGWRNAPSSCGGCAAGAGVGVCCANADDTNATPHNRTSATHVFLDKRIDVCLRKSGPEKRADGLDDRLQMAKNFLLGQRPDQAVNFAPVLQDQQGRDAADAEARRRLR